MELKHVACMPYPILLPHHLLFLSRLRAGCLIWHEKKEGGEKKKRICSDTLDGRSWRKKRKV